MRVLVLIALCATLGTACTERGANSPERVAEMYLVAAKAGNLDALAALAPETFDALAAAQQKATAYASLRGADVRIAYQPNDITPNEMGIEFVSDNPPFHDAVRVERFGSRWYVLLGRARDQGSAPPTAQATRP